MVLIAAAVLPDLPALLDTCTLLGLEAIVEVHIPPTSLTYLRTYVLNVLTFLHTCLVACLLTYMEVPTRLRTCIHASVHTLHACIGAYCRRDRGRRGLQRRHPPRQRA